MAQLPQLRTVDDVITELVEVMMVDTTSPRWTRRQMLRAVNGALRMWEGKVRIGHVLMLDGLTAVGQYGYSLPAYIRPPLTVEFLVWPGGMELYQSLGGLAGTGETWKEAPGWRVEAGEEGGLVLRLAGPGYGAPGRVVWWMPNGPAPLTADDAPPELDGSIGADDSSLTVTGDLDVADAGYVKIGREWISYAGVARGADTVLLNLRRGLQDTTPAVHASEDEVEWGIGVDQAGLWELLNHQLRQKLHEMYLVDGAEHERANHERMLQWYDNKIEELCGRYVPARKVRMRLSGDALL